jgi:hypothetical protein
MLGGDVEERRQHVEIVDDLRDCLVPLRAELRLKPVGRSDRLVAVRGLAGC